MTKLIARFADFRGGDHGALRSRRVPENTFRGENVLAYRDGSIGPRFGVKDTAMVTGGLPAGLIYNMGYIDSKDLVSGSDYVWFHIGTQLWRVPVYDINGFALTAQTPAQVTTGSFAATPTDELTDSLDYEPRLTYFTLYGDKCYYCNHVVGANGTLLPIVGSPGGAALELLNDSLVVGNLTGQTNRIQWSAPGDFTSWPAVNFLDIGAGFLGGGSAIRAMRAVRNQLIVWTDTGQIFIISGTLGVNEVVREYLPGDKTTGPHGGRSIARTRDGLAWWTRRSEYGPVDHSTPFPTAIPVAFTGGQRLEYPVQGGYLDSRFVAGGTDFSSDRLSHTSGVALRDERGVLFSDGRTRLLLFRDGAWSRHDFAAAMDLERMTVGSRGDVFFAPRGGAGERALYIWQAEADQPSSVFVTLGNHFESLTDPTGATVASAAYFYTPEARDRDANELHLVRVDVLFRAYPIGAAQSCTFNVHAELLDVIGNVDQHIPVDGEATGLIAASPTGFTEAAPTGETVRKRRSFFFDVVPSLGFQLRVSNLQGVAIDEILVYGTVEPLRAP